MTRKKLQEAVQRVIGALHEEDNDFSADKLEALYGADFPKADISKLKPKGHYRFTPEHPERSAPTDQYHADTEIGKLAVMMSFGNVSVSANDISVDFSGLGLGTIKYAKAGQGRVALGGEDFMFELAFKPPDYKLVKRYAGRHRRPVIAYISLARQTTNEHGGEHSLMANPEYKDVVIRITSIARQAAQEFFEKIGHVHADKEKKEKARSAASDFFDAKSKLEKHGIHPDKLARLEKHHKAKDWTSFRNEEL